MPPICSLMRGKEQVGKAGAPIPEQTIETMKEDLEWAKDPSDIRAEIEETRARVGNEVDALSYKTDVSARVGDYVDDKKQAVKDKVSGVKDAITGTTSDAVHATSDALPDGQQVGRLKDTAERNPLGLVIGGVAIGFVAGLLLPSTRLEDERMGEMSDNVIDAAKETAGDALESGKQVAHDAADRPRSRAVSSHPTCRSGPRRPSQAPRLASNRVAVSGARGEPGHSPEEACSWQPTRHRAHPRAEQASSGTGCGGACRTPCSYCVAP